MRYLLVLLVVFVISDGFLTEFLIGRGLVREGNPLLQPLVGDTGFLVLKAAGALICAVLLWDIYRRFPRVAMTATWCFVVAYGAILLWNSSMFILA
jgi:hypothetical protein